MENQQTWQKKLLWLIAPLVALLVVGGLWFSSRQPADMQALYAAAVTDAVDADADEIQPLVELTSSNAMTTWDNQGRVLLLSWHNSPEAYPKDAVINLDGEIWTFTDREIAAWYAKNNRGVGDWDLRLEQLIGLPPDAGYTCVSGFWVNADDIIRPAYVTDVTEQMQLAFPEDTDPAFEIWFEENSLFSYSDSAYPWTRLGYTYDWADNGTEYGLTEFLVKKGSSVQIAFTASTTNFVAWLDAGAPLDAIPTLQ